MFNDFWGWLQERRRNNLEPSPLPSLSDFTTTEEYYTTRPEDMPPMAYVTIQDYRQRIYTTKLPTKRQKRDGLRKEDLRLKGRARLAKLANMKHDLAPAW